MNKIDISILLLLLFIIITLIFIKFNNNKKEDIRICYGSPAIWLKNVKKITQLNNLNLKNEPV